MDNRETGVLRGSLGPVNLESEPEIQHRALWQREKKNLNTILSVMQHLLGFVLVLQKDGVWGTMYRKGTT